MDWSDLLSRLGAASAPDAAAPAASPVGGAGDADLAAAEARLRIALPPRYRAFLRASDGFQPFTRAVPRLRPIGKVDWFRTENWPWVKICTEGDRRGPDDRTPDEAYFDYATAQPYDVRSDHLRHALQISDVGDAAVCLLNPQVVDAAGEWEAWFFATWLPGAQRYRSFAAMAVEQVRPSIDVTGLALPGPPPGLPDEYRGGPGTRGRQKVRRPKPRALDAAADDLWATDPGRRRHAAERLARSGNPRAVGPLVALLASPDPKARRDAAHALGVSRDPAAVGPLVAALADPSGRVVNAAMNALGRIGGDRALAALLPYVDRPGSMPVLVAAGALAHVDDPRPAAALARHLAEYAGDGGSEGVGRLRIVANVLAGFGPRGLDALADLAGHPTPAVREASTDGLYTGLSRADHDPAADALRRLADDPDPRVRGSAELSLSLIGPRLGRRRPAGRAGPHAPANAPTPSASK